MHIRGGASLPCRRRVRPCVGPQLLCLRRACMRGRPSPIMMYVRAPGSCVGSVHACAGAQLPSQRRACQHLTVNSGHGGRGHPWAPRPRCPCPEKGPRPRTRAHAYIPVWSKITAGHGRVRRGSESGQSRGSPSWRMEATTAMDKWQCGLPRLVVVTYDAAVYGLALSVRVKPNDPSPTKA